MQLSSDSNLCAPSFKGFEQMYTLIPTVYRALLKSAVSGIGHRIHTTKEKALSSSLQRNVAFQLDSGHIGIDAKS